MQYISEDLHECLHLQSIEAVEGSGFMTPDFYKQQLHATVLSLRGANIAHERLIVHANLLQHCCVKLQGAGTVMLAGHIRL